MVLICLLGGEDTCLRPTGQQTSLDRLGPAQSRYAKNILNLFVDEEIEVRSWESETRSKSKARTGGHHLTLFSKSLSFMATSATPTARSPAC